MRGQRGCSAEASQQFIVAVCHHDDPSHIAGERALCLLRKSGIVQVRVVIGNELTDGRRKQPLPLERYSGGSGMRLIEYLLLP